MALRGYGSLFSSYKIAMVLGPIACVLAVIIVTIWPANKVTPATAAVTATKTADSVQVTEQQTAQLRIVAVDDRPFRIEQQAVGQIAFNDDATTPVVAPFSGRVIRLLAKVGDEVKAGTPLLEIESPEILQAQNDLITALQTLDKARSQLNVAKRGLDRAKDLYQARAGSQRDLEHAQGDFEAAEIDYRAAQGGLTGARNKLRVFGRSDAEVARVERDHVVNSRIIVTAPIDGTVVTRKVGPGQYVRADNTDPLYLIADLSTMWLKANVPENDIAKVHPGQEIEVTVNALPDRVFSARIITVGASSDAVTHRVVVRSEVANPDRVLKPEMFARFRIAAGETPPSHAIPVTAMIRDGNDIVCWVEIGENRFQRRKIKAGVLEGGFVQVLEGIRDGERIVAQGAIFLDNEWHD